MASDAAVGAGSAAGVEGRDSAELAVRGGGLDLAAGVSYRPAAMNRKLSLLCVALTLGCAGSATAAEPPSARQVLILENDATITGQIERVGGVYQVKSASGEALIPASRVVACCENLAEAYGLLRNRANVRDASECVRLARWCWKNGLEEQAQREASDALTLQPRHEEAQRLLRMMEVARKTSRTAAPRQDELPGREPHASPSRSATAPAASAASQESAYTPQTLREFTQRIQPILFNSCATASCHGKANGGSYALIRPASGGQLLADLTRQNLVQTLKHIDREDPAGSRLLQVALEAHGGAARAPMAGKDAVPYQALEAWVLRSTPAARAGGFASELTANRGPLRAPEGGSREDPPRPMLPQALEEKLAKPAVEPAPFAQETSSTPATTEASKTVTPAAMPEAQAELPRKPVTPADAFDPALFNQRFHPRRTGGPGR